VSSQPTAGTDIHRAGRRLVVANRLSELRHVSEWVRGFAHECGLAREAAHDLELVMNEALTNIVSYAYRDEAPHDIVIELTAQPDRICLAVEDDGVAFNPLELRVGKPPAGLAQSRPTGRGVLLMCSLMHELHYARRDNRNVLTMVLHYAKT
jgi:serine/threonine-protein kinase RsbW